jgi:serine O-acetyltransferase
VTFGYAVGKGNSGRPHVGDDVWIGPNCIIAGGLEIGDGSTLLPGTYLTYSVPPRSVVRGNPGRIIREGFDNAALRASLAIVESLPEVESRKP